MTKPRISSAAALFLATLLPALAQAHTKPSLGDKLVHAAARDVHHAAHVTAHFATHAAHVVARTTVHAAHTVAHVTTRTAHSVARATVHSAHQIRADMK